MRKFYIENEKNERFSLWGNRVYMLEPSGLGVKFDASYIQIGNSFLRNHRKIKQSEIGGKIEFLEPGANEKFVNFYNFCAASASLFLIYDSGDGTEYIRDIDIANIDKSERTGATLPIPVGFICKSLYYLRNNKRFTFEPMENEKRYDYAYDFKYGDYGTYEADFDNSGHVAAPFDCMIYGFCNNPSISIVKDGETLAEVQFPVTVEQNEYIRYSSRDGNLEATLVSNDGEENLMNMLDISKENFFKFPIGNSKIRFSSGSVSTNVVTVTIFKMYEVV